MRFENIPTVVFTIPPIGSVGPSEAEAIMKYGKDRIKVYERVFLDYKEMMKANGYRSVIKMVCLLPEEKIISFYGFGDKMDEIVLGMSIAINRGTAKDQFDKNIGVYPTVSELSLNIA